MVARRGISEQPFAVAWQQPSIYTGATSPRKQPEPVNVAEIVRELAEIPIETDTLWRRDRGLNLFGALCKNPQLPLCSPFLFPQRSVVQTSGV